jgi:hypothetical protein
LPSTAMREALARLPRLAPMAAKNTLPAVGSFESFEYRGGQSRVWREKVHKTGGHHV